jgi:hypothetical protein
VKGDGQDGTERESGYVGDVRSGDFETADQKLAHVKSQ